MNENVKERDIWDELEEDLKTATPNTAAGQYNNKKQVEAPQLIERLTELRINAKDEIQAPPIAIKLLNSDSSWSSFGTLGNFSTIIGKAKSRKSFAVSMIAASGLIKAPVSSKFLSSLPEDKSKVLYFDTEQSKYDVQRVVKRIEGLVKGQNMDSFHAFALRSLKPKERLELIEAAINHFENVGLVIIDGIRDLVTSINDEAEATAITSCLLRWTEDKEIHIVNVLHQNKGNEHARGHIGTEMINKSESVFSVAKDPQNDNVSIITPEFTRGKEPEIFAFSVDEQGLPFICGLPENPTKKVESHLLLSNEQIAKLLTDVIKPEMKATEFKQVLKIKLKEDYPRAKTGATSINDFYSWLQLKGYIKPQGTRAAKIVIQSDPHEGEREPEPIATQKQNNKRKPARKQRKV